MYSAIMIELEQKCVQEVRETSPGSLCQGLERRAMWKAFISLPCITFLVLPVVKLTGEGHHHLQDKHSVSQLISKACLCRYPKKKNHNKKKKIKEKVQTQINTVRETTWAAINPCGGGEYLPQHHRLASAATASSSWSHHRAELNKMNRKYKGKK